MQGGLARGNWQAVPPPQHHILRGTEEHVRGRREGASPLELADCGFPMIVLHRARMSACWLANHNIPEPDQASVGLYGHAASNANQ
jgi:hypothetical protein